jgi:hypothetical protein
MDGEGSKRGAEGDEHGCDDRVMLALPRRHPRFCSPVDVTRQDVIVSGDPHPIDADPEPSSRVRPIKSS